MGWWWSFSSSSVVPLSNKGGIIEGQSRKSNVCVFPGVKVLRTTVVSLLLIKAFKITPFFFPLFEKKRLFKASIQKVKP